MYGLNLGFMNQLMQGLENPQQGKAFQNFNLWGQNEPQISFVKPQTDYPYVQDFPPHLQAPQVLNALTQPVQNQYRNQAQNQVGLLDALGYLQGSEEPQQGLLTAPSGGTPTAIPAPLMPMNVPSLQEYLAGMQR